MFFFNNSVLGNYEKTFYDFKIDSISGETINLKDRNIINKGKNEKRTHTKDKISRFK